MNLGATAQTLTINHKLRSPEYSMMNQNAILKPTTKNTCIVHISKLTPSVLRCLADQGITRLELEDLSAYPSDKIARWALRLRIGLVMMAA